MGKTCKNCGKPNHFAKMCRSQQVSEVAEDSEGSADECDQISESVGSCSEFEIMSVQTYQPENERVSISILGALKTNLRSAGWEVKGATFLVSERKTRCIMGLDLQGQVGIFTTQKPAPKELNRFDVLMCEQSEGWKENFFTKFKNLFDRQGISKDHIVSSKFKYPLCPIQEKGRRISIHTQDKVEKEIEKLLTEGHITKLDKCTSDCFIAPIVITVKKGRLNKIGHGRKTN